VAELAHSGAKEIASCEAKLTTELLSFLRSWHLAFIRDMQRLQRSLEMSFQQS